uniref:enoyl-CoA delta isomerase 2, mitochondrial-like n=1 Tax=Ciona intestinalis TaxID=7719 RepID=UPI000180C46F|nr:enoyl-CoA delta isomerase 2, mitochondrial-like [Ciona intestinalis]XP_026689628.1 enoyl-CoA delta isomerase 2, mitochondrial-like [Ciona intestinalis]|eukprot:XP_026689627.1 enoyl-CoA delta isomerase 2, mitochondrial-like [Ciona intestinalis]
MSSKYISFEIKEGYAILRFNRPQRKNAIIPEMQVALTHHLNQLESDESVKVVVLTGTGEYYTSGADFLGGNSMPGDVVDSLQIFKDLVDRLITFPKPIIAAVNGPAIGMGVTTLPLCDVVYASSSSTFITPFSRIAAAPEGCSSYTFSKAMGYAKANEMLLFNRTLSAQEAYTAGLVTEVFPKEVFKAEVQKRVEEIIDNPIKSMIYGKRLIRGPEIKTLLHVNEVEFKRLIERFQSEDVVVQAMKFFQKRQKLKEERMASKL